VSQTETDRQTVNKESFGEIGMSLLSVTQKVDGSRGKKQMFP